MQLSATGLARDYKTAGGVRFKERSAKVELFAAPFSTFLGGPLVASEPLGWMNWRKDSLRFDPDPPEVSYVLYGRRSRSQSGNLDKADFLRGVCDALRGSPELTRSEPEAPALEPQPAAVDAADAKLRLSSLAEVASPATVIEAAADDHRVGH